MGRWMVIAAASLGFVGSVGGAGAQSLDQYENRQVLRDSQSGVSRSLQGRSADTTSTINQRVERQGVQQRITTERFRSSPGLRSGGGVGGPLR